MAQHSNFVVLLPVVRNTPLLASTSLLRAAQRISRTVLRVSLRITVTDLLPQEMDSQTLAIALLCPYGPYERV